MRRLVVVILASTALSGCASFDLFKPSPPPPVTIQLESLPPGADAVTSLGPGCKTPCSVSVPPTPSFTVTFSAPKYQTVTVPVAVAINPGDFLTPASTTVDPNPVSAQLQPLAPPKRAMRRGPAKKPALRPSTAAAPVPAPAPAAAAPPPPPSAASPFPAPRR